MGSGDAAFAGLQASRNGESLLARDMEEGVRLARENPQSGVVVRLEGEARPWNPGAITGGRVWADGLPDSHWYAARRNGAAGGAGTAGPGG